MLLAGEDDTREYTGMQSKFNPNSAAMEISKEQLLEFAQLVKGTQNQDLMAYKDPKVQELIDYITSAIIIENTRLNSPDTFPVQIYRRYKSDKSLKDKMARWNDTLRFEGMQLPDYIGLKIIPEAQHSVFFSDGDPKLQEMIDRRERMREFIALEYKHLSVTKAMTFDEYYDMTVQVLQALVDTFPYDAITKKEYYDSLKSELQYEVQLYNDMHEDSEELMTLDEISELTDINIKKLLAELTRTYPDEVILYKLRKDLMNTFENSELLKNLRNICIR